MTACPNQRLGAFNLHATLRPNPNQVMAGGAGAFLLAFAFFAIVWLHWESVFKVLPILALPFVLTMIAGPACLFVSVRRMTEMGYRKRLALSALLSAAAVGLVALTFTLSLQHAAGGS